jgi:hypothetical protein
MHDRTITWCAAIMWLAMALLCCTAGCFTRTIYVPDGAAVRLRKTIKNAPVWVKDAEGKAVPGKIDLHEGWYCVPMPREEESGGRRTGVGQ